MRLRAPLLLAGLGACPAAMAIDPYLPRSAVPPAAVATAAESANTFNPAISVIFDGVYYQDSADSETSERLEAFGAGLLDDEHDHDESGTHEHDEGGHGHELEEGFSLRETEFLFTGAIDPYFGGLVDLVIADAEDVELEEAYLWTTRLPEGWQLKFGRFRSEFGYLNRKHPHAWYFTDLPLANRYLLGEEGLIDNGVQLNWLASAPFYLRLGAEVLQGDAESNAIVGPLEDTEPFGLDDDAGPRLALGFIKFAPELGYAHTLQLGLSAAWTDQFRQAVDEEAGLAVEGETQLYGADAAYLYDAPGAGGQGDLWLQAELFHRRQSLEPGGGEPMLPDTDPRATGGYAQAVYGVAPRWQSGLRLEALELGSQTDAERQVRRASVNLSFLPTEFSRIRGQIQQLDLEDTSGITQFWLQYTLALGAHGAHVF